MIRFRPARLTLALFFLLAAGARPVTAAEAPPTDRTLESGWSAEGFVDPGYEAERAQIAFDGNGQLISVWSGRVGSTDAYELRWSKLTGTAWSPSVRIFAPTTASERLPQLSRAADGTVWLAWLRNSNAIGSGSFRAPSLLAARLANGIWSPPDTVAVETPVFSEKAIELGFSILAVSRDVAWLTWAAAPDGDPFNADRDLFYSVRSAAGWSGAQLLSNNGLAETRPVLVPTTSGQPVAFFGFSNAPSLMHAVRWTGSAWSSTPDALAATAIYGFDAVTDTNGAVRLAIILRENAAPAEFHLREFTWNDTGFHPQVLINSAPVVAGAENDPPDWSNVAIASGHDCPPCLSLLNDLVFRVLWIDFSQSGAPKVLSSLRTAAGFRPFDQVGTSFETQLAFPSAVHDVLTDRWYATWTAPPTFSGRKRAKFAFTQEFAGDIGLGAALVAPDTVRISVVCSGDATGRDFRIYRLNWPEGQGSPPFSPPVPVAAGALSGNPFAGPCPLSIDDFPGPGRWFYYAELEPEGTFPARSARSFNPAIVPEDGGGGGGGGAVSRLLVPRPQPAFGSVNLPFDLAADGRVILLIRDLRGRAVRRFDLGERIAGSYRDSSAPTWDGKDEGGGPVRAGMYFLALVVDGRATGEPVRVIFLP